MKPKLLLLIFLLAFSFHESICQNYTDQNDGWEKKNLSSGDTPGCFTFSAQYDSTIDNFLKINVGSNTDVVVKLINDITDQCIRYIYVKSGWNYYLRNIPEGIYYLKIGYGQDWNEKVLDNNQCYGKFMRNALYEKGREKLDFNLIMTEDGSQIPMYELFLDVTAGSGNEFHTNNINEAEFNK
jgi:hypothetical protein